MTVSSNSELKQWLESNKISEVECIFPDMAGSSKGKILPVQRFLKSIEDQSLKPLTRFLVKQFLVNGSMRAK